MVAPAIQDPTFCQPAQERLPNSPEQVVDPHQAAGPAALKISTQPNTQRTATAYTSPAQQIAEQWYLRTFLSGRCGPVAGQVALPTSLKQGSALEGYLLQNVSPDQVLPNAAGATAACALAITFGNDYTASAKAIGDLINALDQQPAGEQIKILARLVSGRVEINENQKRVEIEGEGLAVLTNRLSTLREQCAQK